MMSKDRYAISSLNPHTHAGCDTVMGEDVSQRDCFNPHTHAGCDFTIVKISGILLVSIHTPTQGVTYQPLNYRYYYHCFNPHTHAGCDLGLPATLVVHPSFNPHTHAGCDIASTPNEKKEEVSIHTPTQGVTRKSGEGYTYSHVSIHTPTQGVTKRNEQY